MSAGFGSEEDDRRHRERSDATEFIRIRTSEQNAFFCDTITCEIEFDPDTSAKNDKERGLPFVRAADMDWDSAIYVSDQRRDYGEARFLAFAPMDGRLHVACFSIRGDAFRIISFRKANKREEKSNAEATADR